MEAVKILDKWSSQSGCRVQVRARAAVVGCRLGGEGTDGTRSHPELQERTHSSKTSRDIEGEKAKAFGNVSMLSGGRLFNLCSAPKQVLFYLASYAARTNQAISPNFSLPFLRLN